MNNSSPWMTAIKWGAITGLVTVLLSLALGWGRTFESMEDIENVPKWGSYLSYLLAAAGVFMGVKEHRDQDLGGYISLGRSIGVGAIVGLVVGVLSAMYMMWYYEASGMGQLIYENALEKIEESGQDSESAAKMLGFFTGKVFVSIMGLLGSVLLCTIAGVLVGLILQKKPPISDYTN